MITSVRSVAKGGSQRIPKSAPAPSVAMLLVVICVVSFNCALSWAANRLWVL